MADLKFNGNFYFSILSDNGGMHPLLIPRISNPNFYDPNTYKITGPIGIVELLAGDLKITEMIMMKTLEPIFSSLTANPLIAEFIANQPKPLEETNSNALNTPAGRVTGKEASDKAKAKMMENWIPKDSGLKSLEKTIITSMMESHKPLMDFLKILIEMFGLGEDVVCRFLGTSIKVLGKQIGFPSRNPKYWSPELGYAKTMTFQKKEFDDATNAALREFQKSMSDSNPLKDSIKGANTQSETPKGGDDREALYVGYFDEDGNEIEPPSWIKNSNKWFSKQVKDSKGNNITIGAPFKRLSPVFSTGVEQIRIYHQRAIDRILKQKNDMIATITERSTHIEKDYSERESLLKSQNLTKEVLSEELKELSRRKQDDVKGLENEKIEASKEFDDLIQTIIDAIDGTNVAGNNYIDDEDLSQGVNSPSVVSEWMTKIRGSQLRQKYFPETTTTVQALINNKGEGVAPYVNIPKSTVNYRGRNVLLEVPLAYTSQIRQEEVRNDDLFFDQKLTKDAKKARDRYKYSLINKVDNIDIYFNTNTDKPYEDNKITHVTHNEKKNYIPDSLKCYYLPIEWEEIFEYEVRNKTTGELIRKETEVVPYSIDLENDYELRLIEVVNLPLLPPNGDDSIADIMKKDITIIRENNKIQFLKIRNSFDDEITITDAVNTVKSYGSSGSAGFNNTGTINQRDVRYNGLNIQFDIDSDPNFTGNKFKTSSRYAPSLKADDYFYLRKSDSKWGDELISKDRDNFQIYRVKSIQEDWKNDLFVVSQNQSIIIDSYTKTIQLPSHAIKALPDYIVRAGNDNFKINTGINAGKTINIVSYINVDGVTTLTYKGEILSETIINNSFSIQFLDSISVETFQTFTVDKTFNATIYVIDDINYIPDELKNPSKFIIQGLNNKSILSTITDKNKRVDLELGKNPDLEVDGIYSSLGVETYTTKNNITGNVIRLKEKISEKYVGIAYSGNSNDSFYYPLRVLGMPSLKNITNNTPIASTELGTLYSFGNNIPEILKQESPDGKSPVNNLHSTPDLNESNLLKEGRIFQGLDPRYVDRDKYKVFFLVEAIKKDDTGIAPINKKYNPYELQQNAEDKNLINTDQNNGGKGGRVWYNLLDKFTAIPILIAKMVPLIAGKLIPTIIKIIQLVSNPSKIKDLLLDLVLDKSISKFPINFPAFDKDKGALSKVQKMEKKGTKPPKNFDEPDTAPKNPMYYAGAQPTTAKPRIISMMDGHAVAEFGKGVFSKPLFSFGVDVKFSNTSNPLKPITKKKKKSDLNKQQTETKDQPMIELILNFIKMPFEIIFMIFKWIMKWVKKLLNPLKIPAAIAEFISFKWLIDIIGKNSLYKILGLVDPNTDGKIKDTMDKLLAANGDQAQELIDRAIKNLQNGSDDIIEVLVYNLYKNGMYVGQETEERPFSGDSNETNLNKKNADGSIKPSLDIDNDVNVVNTNTSNSTGDPLAFCGPRNFSINNLLPLPFVSEMPKFNMCEMPLIYLKPLEQTLGILKLIQELLNALISMPMSILGLDPQIPIPKFGKEIPFANVFEETLNQIKDRISQVSAKPIK